MSAAPGDRPRDDSFDDKGSPSETKDSEVKHVVSLRRQDPTPSDDAPAPVDDGQPEVEGSPDDVVAAPQTPAATRRWRKAKHAASLLNPAKLVLPTDWLLNRDADLLINLADLHAIFLHSAMARQAAWGRKKKVRLQRQTHQMRERFGFKDPSNGGGRFRLEQRWCEYRAKAPRTRQEK